MTVNSLPGGPAKTCKRIWEPKDLASKKGSAQIKKIMLSFHDGPEKSPEEQPLSDNERITAKETLQKSKKRYHSLV